MSPSRGLLRCFAALCLLHCTIALQAHLAGLADWHIPLIGSPHLSPTPPTLFQTSNRTGLLLTITQKNVLALLRARDGSPVWRHLLDEPDPVVSYHLSPGEDAVLLLSGPSATTARLFNISTGRAIWERPLLDPTKALLTVPVHLGTDAKFTNEPDPCVIVLSDGKRVSKLRMRDGEVIWSTDAPGAGDTVLFKQLHVSHGSIHILALTTGISAQQLSVMTLSLESPVPRADFTQIPSIISSPSDAHIGHSTAAGAASVVWYEHGRIRAVQLRSDGSVGRPKDLLPGAGRKYVGIHSASRRDKGILLGIRTDGGTDIIDVTAEARSVGDWEGSSNSAERSPSVYSSNRIADGVIFSRVYWSFSLNVSWKHSISSDGQTAMAQTYQVAKNGDTIASGHSFAFDTLSYGTILDVSPFVPRSLASADTHRPLFHRRWTKSSSQPSFSPRPVALSSSFRRVDHPGLVKKAWRTLSIFALSNLASRKLRRSERSWRTRRLYRDSSGISWISRSALTHRCAWSSPSESAFIRLALLSEIRSIKLHFRRSLKAARDWFSTS